MEGVKVKSWYEGKEVELLNCPFCGGEPEMLHKGNDYSKKREITVKCTNAHCRIQRTDAALRHGFDWLENMAAEGWNKRV